MQHTPKHTHRTAVSLQAIPAHCSFAPCLCREFLRGRAASGEPRDTFSPWLTLRTEPQPDGLFLFCFFYFACDNSPTAEALIIKLQRCRGAWGAAVQRSAVSLFMKVANGSSAISGCSACCV